MADRRGWHSRYHDEGCSTSQNRRQYEASPENRYRFDMRHSDNNRRENRNCNNADEIRSDSDSRRARREDSRWHDDRGYHENRRGVKERFGRDDRSHFYRKDHHGDRFESEDRKRNDRDDRRDFEERRTNTHSINRNDSRTGRRAFNGRYEDDERHNHSSNYDNRERHARREMEYKPKVINYNFLNELQKEEPSAILATLSNPETGLRSGLANCFYRPHVTKVLLCVLAKSFTSTAAQEKLHYVFMILKESDFIDKSMEFILHMQNENRIHEQKTFQQSIMDLLTILTKMGSVEKYRLSDTQCKGVRAVLEMVIDYLKENTTDVINDELLKAFREFTEKHENSIKGVKRSHNDSSLAVDSEEPHKRLRDIQTASSSEVTQSLLSDPSNKGDNNLQDPSSTDQTEQECMFTLKCGHKCQANCNMEHTKLCKIDVEKSFSCGHKGTIKCYQTDRALCPQPCGAILSCEHPCPGTCGKCFQGRLHLPCENKCKRILVCDHECTGKCNECPPCSRKCENRCQHSKCNKQCGELCVPCREKCTWSCEHFECGKLCSEPCDRPRCDRPCEKRLPCGHQCIGLCGEPCPSDCRICDKEKVTEILFGSEDEPNAKFVLLEDCRAKCIIESDAMDLYMDQKDEHGKIKLKECPKCKTPIRKSNRYRHLINDTLQDIERVKANLLVEDSKVTKLENEILGSLSTFSSIKFIEIVRRRIRLLKVPKSESALVAMQNQLSLLKRIQEIEKEWMDEVQHEDLKGDLKNSLDFLKHFKIWVMRERSVMTTEDIEAATLEISRSTALLKLLLHQQMAKCTNLNINWSLKAKIKETEDILKGSRKYNENARDTVDTCLKELEKEIPLSGLRISGEERVMIVEALKLTQGHWYKCPKGHVYVITECGGAMEVNRCPDCKRVIGGERHQLRGDNEVATEMDGARYAAWSEQANLENYDQIDMQF